MASADIAAGTAHRPALMVRLGQLRLALPLDSVEEILPAMAHTPLPTAPPLVKGVANVRGHPLPLLDLRTRLHWSPRPPHPDDHVVVCRLGDRRAGVWLDHVDGLAEIADEEVVAVDEVADAKHVAGVGLLPDGTVLVCDLRSFLSADEALVLDRALAEAAEAGHA